MLVHRRTRLLRSLGRQLELLWWRMEVVRARLVWLHRMLRSLLVGRQRRRRRLLLWLSRMLMRGTLGTMWVVMMQLWVQGLGMVAQWVVMLRVWVLRLLQQVGHRRRLLRRLVVVLVRVVRARRMWRRRLVWQRVLLWLQWVDRWRMWLVWQVRLLRRLVRGRMRLLLWLVRRLVLLCWLVVVLWRMLLVLLAMLLVWLVGRWQLKVLQRVLWWSEVVGRQRRLVWRRVRR